MTGNGKGASEIPIFEIENGPFNMSALTVKSIACSLYRTTTTLCVTSLALSISILLDGYSLSGKAERLSFKFGQKPGIKLFSLLVN
jgi:hypothetical protein